MIPKQRKLPAIPRRQAATSLQNCVAVTQELGHVLESAFQRLQGDRFHPMLRQACQQVYENICEAKQSGDKASLVELLEAMRSWVVRFSAGGQALVLTLLASAQVAAVTESIELAEQLLSEAEYAATEVYGLEHLQHRLKLQEGSIFFEAEPARAADAYLQCIELCKRGNLRTANRAALQQLKQCKGQCHYRLSQLARRLGDDNGARQHLSEFKRSISDLLGRDSLCLRMVEQSYLEQLQKTRRHAPQRQPAPVLKQVYSGQIVVVEEGKENTCQLQVQYSRQESALLIRILSRRQGKKTALELTHPTGDIDEEKLASIGRDLAWLGYANNKITVSDRQLSQIIRGEPKQTGRSFWMVDRKEIFTDSRRESIERVLGESGSEEEHESEPEDYMSSQSAEERVQQELPPRPRPNMPELPLKQNQSRISHQTTFL